jgi:hypothetical protein
MSGDRRGEGLCGAADGEGSDTDDGIAGLDLLTEFHENLENATGERCADGAVLFRRDDEDGGNFDRGCEIDDGGRGGFEAEVFALGVVESDWACVGGGSHLRAVVMIVAWSGEESGDEDDGGKKAQDLKSAVFDRRFHFF